MVRNATSPREGGDPSDAGLPPGLLRSSDPAKEAERATEVAAALDRVRVQLERTQRTLDAFVTQITGIPVGTAAAPTAASVMGRATAGATAPSPPRDGAAAVAGASAGARPAGAAGGSAGSDLLAPPGSLADHVHGGPRRPSA